MNRRGLSVVALVAIGIGVAAAVAVGSGGAPPVEGSPAPSGPATAPATPSASLAPPSAEPTPEALAWGPTLAEYDAALAEAAALGLDEVIGQVIIAPVSDRDPDAAVRLMRRYHLAGVMVETGAIGSERQTRALTAAVQGAEERPWPAMVAVDEEGGTVARLKALLPDMPAFMAAGAVDDAEVTGAAFASHGAAMRELGFTVTFAPSADVTIGPADPIIRTRSASSDPDRAGRAVVAAVDGLSSGGVVAVPKHYPGHGSIRTDSHDVVSVQRRTLKQMERTDLVPFAAAADAGAPAIMVGHIVVPEWGKRPATVNPQAYQYLRDQLGFDGVIITDSMSMRGVTSLFEAGRPAAEALIAGADIVLMPANTGMAVNHIKEALASGDLTRERLNEAAARSILLARWGDSLDPAAGLPAPGYAREYSAQATVVAARDCDALLGSSVTIKGGTKGQRAWLAESLRAGGVTVSAKGGATTVALVVRDRAAAKADVVVALAGPWGLESSTARAYVAVWGGGPEQMRALGRVLTGDADAAGTWPVDVDVPYAPCA